MFLSSTTVLELELGVLLAERRDATQGAALQCARLHVPDPRAHRDALIAATAKVHGMTVRIVDPWAAV